MKLEVSQLGKVYRAKRGELVALSPTSFSVDAGGFVSLLGPSGCGKSTALQLIAGLDEPSSGEVRLDGARVTGPSAERGMVFQSYTLFPWLSVLENVCFSGQLAQNRRRDAAAKPGVSERARSLLALMGLEQFQSAYPRELSGGMKQRVAIARALVNRPKVLLMDEPFGALDAQTRGEMQELMLRLHARERTTVLFVTHDVEEAIFLSSRILLFSPRPGRVVRDLAVPFGPSAERAPELKLSPEFTELKRELLNSLHPGARPLQGRAALIDSLVKPPARSLQP